MHVKKNKRLIFAFGHRCPRFVHILIYVILFLLIAYYLLDKLIVSQFADVDEKEWAIGAISLEKANTLYRQCCKIKGMPSACWDGCLYNLTLKEGVRIFHISNRDANACDLKSNAKTLMQCANGLEKFKDNRKCCLETGAIKHESPQTDICASLCNPNLAPFEIGERHFKCAPTFKRLFYCHFTNLVDEKLMEQNSPFIMSMAKKYKEIVFLLQKWPNSFAEETSAANQSLGRNLKDQFLNIFHAGATTPIEDREQIRRVEILHEFLNDTLNDKFKNKYPYGFETSACKSNLQELKEQISEWTRKFESEAQM